MARLKSLFHLSGIVAFVLCSLIVILLYLKWRAWIF